MKECSIYYPGFLPCLGWVKASLLYSDELLSVFPTTAYWEQVLNDEVSATDNKLLKSYYKQLNCLKYLHEKELFTPLIASEYLTEETRNRFDREYASVEAVLQADPSQRLFLDLFDKFAPTTNQTTTQVLDYRPYLQEYVSTVNALETDEIVYWVEDNALIDRSLWYLSRLVREGLMMKGRQLTPSTCKSAYHEFVFNTGSDQVEVVNLVIDSCLPVPQANVSPEEILAFKEKYQDEVMGVRKLLKDFEHNLVNVWQEEGVGELLLELETHLFAVLRDISRLMKREGMNMRTATLTVTYGMDRSPNLAAFEKVKHLHGSIVFQQQGNKRRALKLQKTQVAGVSAVSKKLGHSELARVLSLS